ncbi:MAG: CoA transferase [Microthrixaceae bacterium]
MTQPLGEPCATGADEVDRPVSAWAASGAMALTGSPDRRPVGPPAGLVPRLGHVAGRLRSDAARLGGGLEVDPVALLGERAAISGLRRRGDVSCGGSTRLLPTSDGGWLAVTLARSEDVELVPAWLEAEPLADPWPAVATAVRTRPAGDLVARAALLGLPVGLLPPGFDPSERASDRALAIAGVEIRGAPVPPRPLSQTTVVDLSSLWAGPLCGSLLASAGARVIKVESTTRPDGARLGPPAFFDLLNAGKRSVALDLQSREDVAVLRRLLLAADVVIEASRPRALEQLGIDAVEVLTSGRPRAWASITGHGRTVPERDRVAFGDDAAVAGGLVCWTDDRPVFCADAIADPITGMVATASILEALAKGGRWLLDIPLAKVAASMAGPTLAVPDDVVATPPQARVAGGRGPTLGEHTSAVLAELAP